jgi:HAD superfamily hydrolase (TIGR01509 family)
VDFVSRHRPLQTLEQLLAMKRERVVEILRRDQPLFAGLPDLVRELSRHYRLGLASGSERPIVEEVLSLGGLRPYFLATVTGSDIQNGKPAPDIFLRTAELLGVPPAECCVIEDSRPGIAAGLAAGMRVIAITNTHSADQLTHASCVVETYEQIGQLLLNSSPT